MVSSLPAAPPFLQLLLSCSFSPPAAPPLLQPFPYCYVPYTCSYKPQLPLCEDVGTRGKNKRAMPAHQTSRSPLLPTSVFSSVQCGWKGLPLECRGGGA